MTHRQRATTHEPATRRRLAWLTFDRQDRFSLVTMLGLVLLGTLAVTVIQPVVTWVRGGTMHIPFTSPIRVPALDAVGQRYALGEYDRLIAEPTTSQRLLHLAPGVLTSALVAVACWLVAQLLRDIGHDEPFTPRNITRLRVLALVLAFGFPIAAFARFSCAGAILGELDLGGLAPLTLLEIPWLPVVLGACAALMAEAFRTGARLRSDVEGLI